MRSQIFTLLACVTLAVAAEDFSSFQDFLDQLPSCSRDCITPLYDDILEDCDASRSSTDRDALVCVCEGGDLTTSQESTRGNSAGRCAREACSTSDAVDVAQVSLDFVGFCIDLVGNNTTLSAPTGTLVNTGSTPTATATSDASASESDAAPRAWAPAGGLVMASVLAGFLVIGMI